MADKPLECTFSLVEVRNDLDLPFEQWVEFRDGIWADQQVPDSKGRLQNRIGDAGLENELDRSRRDWASIHAPCVGLRMWLVVAHSSGAWHDAPDAAIVGVFRVRDLGDNTAAYSNVLYRRPEQRHGVSPSDALSRFCDHLRDQGFTKLIPGEVRNSRVTEHMRNCCLYRIRNH